MSKTSLVWEDLNDEQKGCVEDIAENWWRKGQAEGFGDRPNYSTEGPAGSGKSSLLVFAAEQIGVSDDELASMALSGKAALVMRRKGMLKAQTAHSAIYTPLDEVGERLDAIKAEILNLRGDLGALFDDDDASARARTAIRIKELEDEAKTIQQQAKEEMRWILNPHGALGMARLGFVDEASMIGGQLQQDMESIGTPILYAGDGFQLPPIDSRGGSVFFDEYGRPKRANWSLTKIHRQAEGSAIIRYSRDIRENRSSQYFYGKDTSDDGGLVMRVRAGRLSIEHLARAEQVIVGKNDTRVRTNQEIRRFLGREGSLYPVKGDKLICLQNNRDMRLVNGMMAWATSDYRDFDGRSASFEIDLEMEDGRRMGAVRMLSPYFQYPGDKDALRDIPRWARQKHAHFDYGYAITCHKAQGSQYRSGVVLEEPFGRTDEERRRWRYTAATRFEHSVIIEA